MSVAAGTLRPWLISPGARSAAGQVRSRAPDVEGGRLAGAYERLRTGLALAVLSSSQVWSATASKPRSQSKRLMGTELERVQPASRGFQLDSSRVAQQNPASSGPTTE